MKKRIIAGILLAMCTFSACAQKDIYSEWEEDWAASEGISGDFKDKNEVRTICKSLLPAYQMPTVINLMESLPKNGSGKIIRKRNYKGGREDGT